MTVPKLRSSFETEAEALKWALETMVKLSYTRFIFETDSLILTKMVGEYEIRFYPRRVILNFLECLW
ncbi:unnamed protein product [Eruca vesicaria subsp. sativa]|uniref:RNase H type-1 domain-containing protein n=1 Tax=Eruca vesicaria subsp. sativa TaxID=29727 RepID=A0ABC8KDQ9_ERUVS|nr:unnamed protein product [Eruca vesicaria subsp. sativa]